MFEGDRRLGIVECIPLAAEAEALEIPEQVALGDRLELREILKRLFQSLREDLDEDIG